MNLEEALKEWANDKALEIYKEVHCIKDMYRPIFFYIITHGYYKMTVGEIIQSKTQLEGKALTVKLLDFCESLSIRYDQSEKLKPDEFMDSIKDSGELTELLNNFLHIKK